MSEYDKEPLSRVEEILDETSSGTEYDKEPLSRVELRLKEVMAKIDGLVPDATVYKAGGSVTFANLPAPSKSTLGYVYDVSDAFTTTSDFKEGSGKKYPAGTNVAIVDIGTDENPIYKYDVLSGFIDMDNYVEKEAGKGLSSNDFTNEAKNKLDDLENYDDTEIKNDLSALSDTVSDKVDKVSGKGLSTNDYTDADKALVADSPITVTATASPISTANGKPRAITIYGKSEIVDGAIKSAGEGYAVVDLGALNWSYAQDIDSFYSDDDMGIVKTGYNNSIPAPMLTNKYITTAFYGSNGYFNGKDKAIAFGYQSGQRLYVKDNTYPNPAAFKTAMQGVLLCYQLADPTQGNAIAVKTDNGTGIDGTMATFSTGTPLRGIPDSNVRDVMTWDGSSGEMTKNCAKVRLADLTWQMPIDGGFSTPLDNSARGIIPLLCSAYNYNDAVSFQWANFSTYQDKNIYRNANISYIYIKDTDYTTVSDFVASLGDAELVYEIETPTTTPLTQTENDSIAGLRTFAPQTHAQNNAGATMTIEAYAGTANGQLISDMQPTRSPLLTLSASGWTNNAQTVTYEHDIGKRNTIDVESASIKAWTAAGILATSETATSITFECDTTPTADLSFRVTSMEVR